MDNGSRPWWESPDDSDIFRINTDSIATAMRVTIDGFDAGDTLISGNGGNTGFAALDGIADIAQKMGAFFALDYASAEEYLTGHNNTFYYDQDGTACAFGVNAEGVIKVGIQLNGVTLAEASDAFGFADETVTA